jgi:hypothetical protein
VDGSQFDTVTRMFARRPSRRALLGGLVAGLLAARDRSSAVAQGVFLGPGEPCYDDAQCRGADAPLVCADNGFAYDGPLNCCTDAGSRCGVDEACCGTASCLGGICAYAGPGDPCQHSSQCVAADTAVSCDYVVPTDDYRCCAYEGSRCGWDGGCCGSLRCSTGVCTDPNASAGSPGTIDSGLNQTGYGFPPGQACIADAQCDNSFPELGISYCADTGYVYGGMAARSIAAGTRADPAVVRSAMTTRSAAGTFAASVACAVGGSGRELPHHLQNRLRHRNHR